MSKTSWGQTTERAAVKRQTPATAERGRVQINFNHDWHFCRCERGKEVSTPAQFNGQAFAPVDLPHSVRLEPLNASGGRNFQGVCWYRKNLRLPPEWEGRIIQLQFQGAMQAAGIWLNGRKIAEHHCGYTPFTVDLTRLLRPAGEENLTCVRLDNRDNPQIPPGKPQRELDFCYFGGLYRNVVLQIADPLHITDPILEDKPAGGGVFVSYADVGARSASVRVQTEIRNDFLTERRTAVRQELIDAQGKVVAADTARQTIPAEQCRTFSQTLSVSRPRLWHPDHPNLYRLRTIALDGDREVDEQTTAIGIREIRFDAAGLRINGERFLTIGANRHQDHPYVGYALPDSAHWRDAKKLRDGGFTCVRCHYPQAPAFMDACDELGLLTIVSNPGWQFTGDEEFGRRATANARCMVRRDRNRPSVILWEAALNESDNRLLGPELHRAVHEEFPGEECFTAGDHQRPAKWDVEYLHNDPATPLFIREFGDHVDNWRDQQSRSRVRRAWGEAALLAQAKAHIARLNEVFAPGNRLAGACLWAGIDCQRGYHLDPFYGGALDLFRIPKFNYFLFQSQRPAQLGPMVFIATHGTFFSGESVLVFSNCDEVRLLNDGKEVARLRPDGGYALPHPPFTFTVQRLAEQSTLYMGCGAILESPPRELKAEGLIGGKVAATHIVRPPGVAAAITLEADLCGRALAADRSDWVRVHALVRDARGVVCALSDAAITFTIEGEGAIIIDPDSPPGVARAEAGVATILVRSSGRPGKIRLAASAFGLTEGRLTLTAGAPSDRLLAK